MSERDRILDELDAIEKDAAAKSSRLARAYYKASRPWWGTHPWMQTFGIQTPMSKWIKMAGTLLVVPILVRGVMISVKCFSESGECIDWPFVDTVGGYFASDTNATAVQVISSSLPVGLLAVQALKGSAKVARCIIPWNGLDDFPFANLQGHLVIAAAKDEGKQAENLAAQLGAGVAIPSGCMGSTWAEWRLERMASLAKADPRKSAVMLERGVDALLSLELMRHAIWLPPKSSAQSNGNHRVSSRKVSA